jgi:hypothetical protein
MRPAFNSALSTALSKWTRTNSGHKFSRSLDDQARDPETAAINKDMSLDMSHRWSFLAKAAPGLVKILSYQKSELPHDCQ